MTEQREELTIRTHDGRIIPERNVIAIQNLSGGDKMEYEILEKSTDTRNNTISLKLGKVSVEIKSPKPDLKINEDVGRVTSITVALGDGETETIDLTKSPIGFYEATGQTESEKLIDDSRKESKIAKDQVHAMRMLTHTINNLIEEMKKKS